MKKRVIAIVTAFLMFISLFVCNINASNGISKSLLSLKKEALAVCEGNGGGVTMCCDETSGNCLWGDSGGTYDYDHPYWKYP